MRFSLRLNNDQPIAEFAALASRAESAGFDQIWVSNDLFLQSAPVLLSAAATRTETIRIGCGVFNPYTVHPAELAMIATSLQELSRGRFLLGVAAGAAQFLGWAGIEQRRPLRTTRAAVEAIRALTEGRVVEQPGWTENAYLRLAAAGVPIYIGAMSPRMLELAGECADGALPLLFPPEHFTTARNQIHTGLARAGRDPAGFDLPACVWCSVDADRDAARSAMADKIAYYGASFSPYLLERAGLAVSDFDGARAALARRDPRAARALVDEQMLRLGIAGDVEEVITRCNWLIEHGADHISFGPPLGPVPAEAIDLLGRDVLPALSSSIRERTTRQ